MMPPETVRCDKCENEAAARWSFNASTHRGKGVLAFIDCPGCSRLEQWIVKPGEAEPDNDAPHT
jgi:hypothetical protein